MSRTTSVLHSFLCPLFFLFRAVTIGTVCLSLLIGFGWLLSVLFFPITITNLDDVYTLLNAEEQEQARSLKVVMVDSPCGYSNRTGCYVRSEGLIELKHHPDDYYVAAILIHELTHASGGDECGAERSRATYLKRVGRGGSAASYGVAPLDLCFVPRDE